MSTKTESSVSRALRVVLAGLPDGSNIPRSEAFESALVGLEFFLPLVLREVYREWKYESLDGVFPLVARRISEDEIEILGTCILISDQSLTLLHLHLQIPPSSDEVSWLECRLGEKGKNGMIRMPHAKQTEMFKRASALEGNAELIEWQYKVTYGIRRESQIPG